MAGELQVQQRVKMYSTGYPGEEVGAEGDYKDKWYDYPLGEQGTAISTYYYRDTDIQPPTNANSSRVDVTVKDVWTSIANPDNSITIIHSSWLQEIKRGHILGNPGNPPGRSIKVGPSYGKTLPNLSFPNTNINRTETIFSGNAQLLYEHRTTLYPGEETNFASVYYYSVTVGYEAYAPPGKQSQFSDEFSFGIFFRNNLPKEVPAPVLQGIAQNDRICDNLVDAFLTFENPPVSGIDLVLQYRYEGQEWSEERQTATNAYRDAETIINVYDLIPRTKVYWRAKYVPTLAKVNESEWAYGEFTTMFIPPTDMTVPDISTPECTAIGRGDYIEKYKDIVYYNEDLRI